MLFFCNICRTPIIEGSFQWIPLLKVFIFNKKRAPLQLIFQHFFKFSFCFKSVEFGNWPFSTDSFAKKRCKQFSESLFWQICRVGAYKQKQVFADVLQNRWSLKFCKLHDNLIGFPSQVYRTPALATSLQLYI